VSIHDDRHIPSATSALGTGYIRVDAIAHLADDFDQVAVVVDWLDACRNRDLTALLALYAHDAKLECQCGEVESGEGLAGLESYWRPRLATRVASAFGLQEITPTAEGVVLDYLSHEGKPVRMAFSFTRDARIKRTFCAPSGQMHAVFGVASQAD
jgi:hypothetical protein